MREKRSVGDPIKKSCVKECRVDIAVWEDTDTGCLRECHMLPAGM